jgi:hypothetical protein
VQVHVINSGSRPKGCCCSSSNCPPESRPFQALQALSTPVTTRSPYLTLLEGDLARDQDGRLAAQQFVNQWPFLLPVLWTDVDAEMAMDPALVRLASMSRPVSRARAGS